MKRPVLLAVALAVLPHTGHGVAKPAASKPAPAKTWKNGLPRDPHYFPIGVWLQNPENAKRFRAAGINLYIGLWQGPTEEQLAALKSAGMPVICEQNAVGLAHQDDPTIVGWMHGDEPDNAQPMKDPVTGKQTYGPCVPPAQVVSHYQQLKSADPTRPILLNLGEGVANDEWIGRGEGAKLDDYKTYVQGADIVSFDVYPIAGLNKPDGENYLWYVAKGVRRLRQWTAGRQRVWNCIECTRIDQGTKPTPAQVRSEVWMALIHGSTGLIYFNHQFKPQFDEHALLDDPEMLAAVTAINGQIRQLAPILNSPTLAGVATVVSSAKDVPIDTMAKRSGSALYVFAVGMRNGQTRGAFTVKGLPPTATAEVLGESRRLTVKAGKFSDDFKPYGVHLYRIVAPGGKRRAMENG